MKRKTPPSLEFFAKENPHYSLDLTQQVTSKEFGLFNKKIKTNNIKSIALNGDLQGNYRTFILKTIQLANKHKIEKIDLGTTSIGDEGVNLLQNILKENQFLKTLDLGFTELTDKQVTALSEALKENTTLTKLDLSSNDITEPGMKALNKALQKNITLKELDLSYNPDLGDDGILAFCPTLEHNKKLEVLNLRQCNISDEGFKGIKNALKNNPNSLKKLDMRDNEMSEAEANSVINLQTTSENEHEIREISPLV